ncbi:sulfatase [Daejeonella sp.]|uniref:sulfatase family protein n=1 Tax=Daejeonella sp. TaxID=2805397 RepID=UPI0039834AE0
MKRKQFFSVKFSLLQCLFLIFYANSLFAQKKQGVKPNIIYIIVDQWRAQATGYSGDKNVITPNLDRLASQSMNVKNAVSGMPVCTPHRASLMTGQYPLTTGVFMNDVMLDTAKTTIAKQFMENGYNTAFIGKWHIDGHGRKSYIPENRRQGFEYWKALECAHDYNNSNYYAGNSDKKLLWDGYDAIAQSDDACRYIREQSTAGKPFILFLSLAPPHDPYQTAPQKYRAMYENKDMHINANVPAQFREKVQKDLKGYYSHITALDDCVGRIWQTIKDAGIEKNSILVFTADHGDLLGAHGSWNKQQPYEESIRVPFLVHYPAVLGLKGKTSSVLLNTPDIMPTLLGFSNIPVPASVEGKDLSQIMLGKRKDNITGTMISCIQPFGQWTRKAGGKEYRGIVTKQFTYARDLKGAWLLFDNIKDPFQLNNLVDQPGSQQLKEDLNTRLNKMLRERKDELLPGMEYVKKWNYVVDETETVPYIRMNYEGKAIIE